MNDSNTLTPLNTSSPLPKPQDLRAGPTDGILYALDPFQEKSVENVSKIVNEIANMPREVQLTAQRILAYLAQESLPAFQTPQDQQVLWDRVWTEKCLRLLTWTPRGMLMNETLERIRLKHVIQSFAPIMMKLDRSSGEMEREKRLATLSNAERSSIGRVMATSFSTVLEFDPYKLDKTNITSWNLQLIARYVGVVPRQWFSGAFLIACFNHVYNLLDAKDTPDEPWLLFSQDKLAGISAVTRILANWALRLNDLDPLSPLVDSVASFYNDLTKKSEVLQACPTIAVDALTGVAGVVGLLPEMRRDLFAPAISNLTRHVDLFESTKFIEPIAYMSKDGKWAKETILENLINITPCPLQTGATIYQAIQVTPWSKDDVLSKFEGGNSISGLYANASQWNGLVNVGSHNSKKAARQFWFNLDKVLLDDSRDASLALAYNLSALVGRLRPWPREFDTGNSSQLLKRLVNVLIHDTEALAYPNKYFKQVDDVRMDPKDSIFDFARCHTQKSIDKLNLPSLSRVIGNLAAHEWEFGNMASVQSTFEDLNQYCTRLDQEWHTTQLSKEPRLQSANIISMYHKAILYSISVVGKVIVEDCVTIPRRNISGLAANPESTRDLLLVILDTFSHLHFIVRRFSSEGFEDWRTMILETCGWLHDYDIQNKTHFLQNAIQTYLEAGSDSKWEYGMLVARHVLDALEPQFVDSIIIPQIRLHWSSPGKTAAEQQVFEVAHNMASSLSSYPKLFSRDFAKEYIDLLLKGFPETMSLELLQTNFTEVVKSLADHGQEDLSWQCVQQLIDRIDSSFTGEVDSGNNSILSSMIEKFRAGNVSEDDVLTLKRMATTQTDAQRTQLILLLFSQIKAVSLNHLDVLLEKIGSIMLTGRSTPPLDGDEVAEPRESPLWQALYDVISSPQGFDYIKRNRCVVWFLELQKGAPKLVPEITKSKL